tara:strand:+ start:349 stop:504 length:156 start_codon:yes stop_codon:yes gene_type:complete
VTSAREALEESDIENPTVASAAVSRCGHNIALHGALTAASTAGLAIRRAGD